MSLYHAKHRAIRQTLLFNGENYNKLTKYLQEQGIEDMPYSQLAEHFINNGDCGLDVDLEMPLRDAFANYVDESEILLAFAYYAFQLTDEEIDSLDASTLIDEEWDDVIENIIDEREE